MPVSIEAKKHSRTFGRVSCTGLTWTKSDDVFGTMSEDVAPITSFSIARYWTRSFLLETLLQRSPLHGRRLGIRWISSRNWRFLRFFQQFGPIKDAITVALFGQEQLAVVGKVLFSSVPTH